MKLLDKFKDYLVKDDMQYYLDEIAKIEEEANLSEAQKVYLDYKYPIELRVRLPNSPYSFKLKDHIKKYFYIRQQIVLRKDDVNRFSDFVDDLKSTEIWRIRQFVANKFNKILL